MGIAAIASSPASSPSGQAGAPGHRLRASVVLAVVLGLSMVLVMATPSGAASTTHTVQSGETLSEVAQAHGLTVAQLQAYNGLDDIHRIQAGRRLWLVPPQTNYTVRSGDTLGGIAVRFGTTSAQLVELNGLANPHRIRAGSVLVVPDTGVHQTMVPARPASTRNYPNLPARIRNNPERLALLSSFEHWAEANGIPTDLLMALAWQESGWNNTVESHKGAYGIGQLMPATAVWIATDLIGRPELDRRNPEDNIRMSARYLRALLQRFGNETEAIGAYFQGQTSVARGDWMDATEQYVANVQAHRWMFTSS